MLFLKRPAPRLHPAAVPLSRFVLLITPTINPVPSVASELLVTTQ